MSDQTTSLADQAYARLEEMIITLELPPGHLLSEAALSRRTEIGRTPLREAIQRLVRDRLMAVFPRKGIMISQVHLAEHLMLLETRRVLDRLVTAQAARRATGEQRAALATLFGTTLQAAESGDLRRFMHCDKAFDEIVETASSNTFAADALAPMHAHCRRFWYMYRSPGDLKRSASLHGSIMEAVEEGDPDDAAVASDRLIDYLKQFTRAALGSL